MTDKQTYNGFANYETWAVALWLGNDWASYQQWREISHEVWQDMGSVTQKHLTPFEAASIELADRLKAEVEDGVPLTAPSMYTDLLQGALAEVDWYEIAGNLLEEAKEGTEL